jgi:hypothetical protein
MPPYSTLTPELPLLDMEHARKIVLNPAIYPAASLAHESWNSWNSWKIVYGFLWLSRYKVPTNHFVSLCSNGVYALFGLLTINQLSDCLVRPRLAFTPCQARTIRTFCDGVHACISIPDNSILDELPSQPMADRYIYECVIIGAMS